MTQTSIAGSAKPDAEALSDAAQAGLADEQTRAAHGAAAAAAQSLAAATSPDAELRGGIGAIICSWSLLFTASCRSQAEIPLIPIVRFSEPPLFISLRHRSMSRKMFHRSSGREKLRPLSPLAIRASFNASDTTTRPV